MTGEPGGGEAAPPDGPVGCRPKIRTFDHEIVDLAVLARDGIQPPAFLCDGLLCTVAGSTRLPDHQTPASRPCCSSWCVLLLAAGETAVLLDEESGREATVEKLLALGSTPDHLERLVYVEYPGRRWDCRWSGAPVLRRAHRAPERRPAG